MRLGIAVVLVLAFAGVADAKGKSCPSGQVKNSDTDGHCCWPGQAWLKSKSKCVGAAGCPAGLQSEGEACVTVPVAPVTDAQKAAGEDARKRGLEKIKASDFDGALVLLRKAVDLDGRSPDNLRALAGVLARTNQFDEAVIYYRRFLEVAPNDPSAPQVRQALSDYEASNHK